MPCATEEEEGKYSVLRQHSLAEWCERDIPAKSGAWFNSVPAEALHGLSFRSRLHHGVLHGYIWRPAPCGSGNFCSAHGAPPALLLPWWLQAVRYLMWSSFWVLLKEGTPQPAPYAKTLSCKLTTLAENVWHNVLISYQLGMLSEAIVSVSPIYLACYTMKTWRASVSLDFNLFFTFASCFFLIIIYFLSSVSQSFYHCLTKWDIIWPIGVATKSTSEVITGPGACKVNHAFGIWFWVMERLME